MDATSSEEGCEERETAALQAKVMAGLTATYVMDATLSHIHALQNM